MLFARFDATRLRAIPPDVGAMRTCLRTEALVAACLQGAGPADRPRWRPWTPPRIERPFALLCVDDVAVAHRACLWLDCTWQLWEEGSAVARLGLRLRTKWADAAWWRPLQIGDPWDAGISDRPESLVGFRPRRATLIVIEKPLDEAGRLVLAQLAAEAGSAPRAVRVVLVEAADVPGTVAAAAQPPCRHHSG